MMLFATYLWMTLVHAVIHSSGLQKKSNVSLDISHQQWITDHRPTHVVIFRTEHIITQTVHFKYETRQ